MSVHFYTGSLIWKEEKKKKHQTFFVIRNTKDWTSPFNTLADDNISNVVN
jgi:hypothetical protein